MPELTINVDGHTVKIEARKTWGKIIISVDGKSVKESRIFLIGEKEYSVNYGGHEIKFVIKIPAFGLFRKWKISGYVDGQLKGTN
ncbi:MAG: hypothetical protein ACE5KE_01500 [Methanosarcinales archaeon]